MMYSPERLKILSFATLAAPNQKYGDVTSIKRGLKKLKAVALRGCEILVVGCSIVPNNVVYKRFPTITYMLNQNSLRSRA